MKKTYKIWGIILLVLGLLAIAGGIGVSIYNRSLLGDRFADFRQGDFPQRKEGERLNIFSRKLPQRFFRFAPFGFFGGWPIFLIIGGGALLIGGVALLIIAKNKAQAKAAVIESVKTKKKPAATKTAKKRPKRKSSIQRKLAWCCSSSNRKAAG